MIQLEHILALVDPARPESAAVRHAVEHARKAEARLTLGYFAYNKSLIRARLGKTGYLEEIVREHLAEAAAGLEDLADGLRSEGLEVDVHAEWGKPVPAVVAEWADENDVDLVVGDAHHENTLRRFLFTPDDWHLLRLCPAKVMIVGGEGKAAPQRILAAVDPVHHHGKPEELDERIVSDARKLGERFGAEVHVAHAFEYMPPAGEPMGGGYLLDQVKYLEESREVHEERFTEFCEAHGIEPSRRHFLEGMAEDALAQLARDLGADLIVLGTGYVPSEGEFRLGTTSEKILDRAGVDVLTVKPSDFTARFRESHKKAEHRIGCARSGANARTA